MFNVIAVIAVAVVLVAWFRVHIGFLVFIASLWLLSLSSWSHAVPLLLALPVAYVAVVVALLFVSRRKPAFASFRAVSRWPLGALLFDKVGLALIAPHKSLYGLRTVSFTETELVVAFRLSYWLLNPFGSVDVGPLCGIGEMVAFGASQYAISKSGMRAIPVGVRAEFVKKARGGLVCSAHAAAVAGDKATLVAEIREARTKELCCKVFVDMALSPK